jgi:uncharacterized protein (TIGR03382 family)
VTVGPPDTTSGSGPSFAVPGGVQPGETITIETTGIMYLQAGGTQYGTNAAGIVVVAGTAGVGASGINTGPGPGTGRSWGAWLLGNSVDGFFQVYASDASNGLCSVSPPTDLLTTLNLSSFAGGSLVGATTLEFLLSDTVTSDNSGLYAVSTIPEPASAALAGFGLLAALALVRRRKV